jgi:hypothetical protein
VFGSEFLGGWSNEVFEDENDGVDVRGDLVGGD